MFIARVLFMSYVVLSFGSNICGKYGKPINSISIAIKELEDFGLEFINISSIYRSKAVGAAYQPHFYNLVTISSCSVHPNKLLKKIKQLEISSGRKGALFWGARPLDIDIIDYNSKVWNWPDKKNSKALKKIYGSAKVSPLTYPHLQMHKRSFVLKPLAEICPNWRHPVLNLSVNALTNRYCSPLEMKSIEKLDISINL